MTTAARLGVLSVLLLGAPRTVVADEPQPFAALVEVSSSIGATMGFQLTLDRLGARVTGGYNTVVVLASDGETHLAESFHMFPTGQLNADAFALLYEGLPGVYLGASAGYKWNTLLGHGFGGGVDLQIARSRHIGWHVGWTVAWFPDGDERILRDRDLPPDTEFNFPFGAGYQSGLSFGLMLIP